MTIENLTALLVLVTAYYAWVTARILRANREVIQLMKQEQDAQKRPYVVVSPFSVPRRDMLYLKIANLGRSPATNLKLSLSSPFYQFGKKQPETDLSTFWAFRSPVPSFAPGAEIIFYLANGLVLFGDKVDAAVTPLVFHVSASYDHEGKSIIESTTVDLNQFRGAALQPDPLAHELAELTKVLVVIGRELRRRSD